MSWFLSALFATVSLFASSGCQNPEKHLTAQPSPTRTYASASAIPVEEFFRNPQIALVRISPDGTKIAYLKNWKSRLNIFVQPVGQPEKTVQVTQVDDRDITEYAWKGNDTILFKRDFGGNENFHVVAADLRTGKNLNLVNDKEVRSEIVDDLVDISDTDILLQTNKRNKEVFDVYRVNVITGESKLVAQNDLTIETWITDHTGAVRGGVASDGVNGVLYLNLKAGEPFKKIFETNFRTSLTPQAFAADNQRLYVKHNIGRDNTALVEMDPRQPKEKWFGRILYTNKTYDFEGAHYSDLTGKISNIEIVTDRRTRVFLDPKDQADWDYLHKQHPAWMWGLGNTSKDERKWVVRGLSDTSMGQYFIFDRDARKLIPLDELAPWIKSEQMSEMKTVRYKSRDGLTIEGYLTIPRGSTGKNLPVVINPHGGPWHRDEWGFNGEAQFLASRGYAVLAMNFRGSTGYGRKFWEASFKQWGKTMQNDITDGVEWLVKNGVADPKRVAIYGASYGGYATLAGLAFTPDLYAAGIDYVGVSNIFTLMATMPPYWESGRKMLYEMVGNPETEKELLTAASPVFHADKIKAPLFVAQGANDPRVKKSESDQIVEALRKRGVAVDYMVKDNEGHGFSNEENRFEFYRAMEAFLDKHVKNRN